MLEPDSSDYEGSPPLEAHVAACERRIRLLEAQVLESRPGASVSWAQFLLQPLSLCFLRSEQ